MATEKLIKQEQIEVTLDKKHKHRGDDCEPGSTIMVTPSQARWLLNNKVIKSIPGAGKSAASKPPPESD